MSLVGFVIRRVLIIIPTLWVIATLTFFLVHAAPGGPFQAERDIPAAHATSRPGPFTASPSISTATEILTWSWRSA